MGADATDCEGWTGSGGVACVCAKKLRRHSSGMVKTCRGVTIVWFEQPGSGSVVGPSD